MIGSKTPSSVPRALSRPKRVKITQGFEDQPTEVQLPPSEILDDESTAEMSGEEAAVITEQARRGAHPPAPSHTANAAAARRQTLVARRGADFSDDSKTDVMTPDLRSRMREVRHGSPPLGPTPGTPSTPARSRKR